MTSNIDKIIISPYDISRGENMKLQDSIEILKKKVVGKIAALGTHEAARQLGCNYAYVSRIRNGRISISAKKLMEIAEALGVKDDD